MTALADARTIVELLKGSSVTNAQLARIADAFGEYLTAEKPTVEQRAAGLLLGLRTLIRQRLREQAEGAVYAAVIRQPHLAGEQQALLLAVKGEATAAGDAAAGEV